LKIVSAAIAVLLLAASATAAALAAPKPASVEFSESASVIELKDVLLPYSGPAAKTDDSSRWYMMTAVNEAVRPVTRVLVAEDPPNAFLQFFPRRARPETVQVAASDSAVVVEPIRAFGRHAYQITIPPATSATVALRVAHADDPPSLLAWTEAGLAAHNRQVAIFLAGVAGLIAAALVILAGVAAATAHPVPCWAAITLALLFLMRLQGAGVFDAGWFTYIGGPYGLSAMLAGLAFAAALRLADLAVPFAEAWPIKARWKSPLLMGLAGLSLLAFVGIPGAAVLVCLIVLAGTGGLAAYLVHRGLTGSRAARVLAPSATVFALVTAVYSAIVFGAFQENPMAPGAVAGFVGVGAVLLALAVAAGEGIAILPIAGRRLPRPHSAIGPGQPPARQPETLSCSPAPASQESKPVDSDGTRRDRLTGLGTRAALLDDLRHLGNGSAEIALAVMDIDRFKSIHASLGDAGGDKVLVELGSRLANGFGGTARVYRVGGDAFALAMPATADCEKSLGRDVLDLCSEPVLVNGRKVFASTSIGVVVSRDVGEPHELIGCAEKALDTAKRRGGGRSVVYAREMARAVRKDAVALETELRRGLAQKEFEVFYQPIVRLRDGSVAGFEVLLRWQHPEQGMILPADFIAHSEITGSVVALGQFTLEHAAMDLADWQRSFPRQPPLFVSVNLSRRQLGDKSLIAFLRPLLAAVRLEPGSLMLEVTESAIAGDQAVLLALEELREAGAVLAMDDFGTGLSSFSQLKDLPFDIIKIDKSFLADRPLKNGASAVITSVIALAHEMGRTVIAEGVEKEADALWLRELGCEYAQGFHFAPPMTHREARQFVAKTLENNAAPPEAAQARPA